MPIDVAAPITVLNQEQYHAVDRRVTGLAFEIQNEFGRYLDEQLYQEELARRCRADGLYVVSRLQIQVRLDDFRKRYYADLLVDPGVIVEIKAVEALTDWHMAQALNCVLLCGLHHGSLLNFASERVVRQFVSTRLTPTSRRCVEWKLCAWRPLTAACRQLLEVLQAMMTEWGAYLDLALYREALMHFLGGSEIVAKDIAVYSGGECIGSQKMLTLRDDIAFEVAAVTRHPDALIQHQQRLLEHTKLRALHLINLNHGQITIRTLENR